MEDQTPVIFVIDMQGGMVRALKAMLVQAGCQVDIVLISMCRSRDTRYGRADALVVDATRQWGNSVVQGATKLTYATPWLTLIESP